MSEDWRSRLINAWWRLRADVQRVRAMPAPARAVWHEVAGHPWSQEAPIAMGHRCGGCGFEWHGWARGKRTRWRPVR